MLKISYKIIFHSNKVADKQSQTALHLTFSKEGHDPMELLHLISQKMGGENIDQVDEQGQSALHKAAEIGACASIIHLLKMNAQIDLKDQNGNTPISLAIKNRHQAATILLCQLGAELKVNVVYIPEMSVETPDQQFWTYKKKKEVQKKIVSKPAIQVVIQHEWRNVTTLMGLQLLQPPKDDSMETDQNFKFASIVEAACRVPDFETAMVFIRRQTDDSQLKQLNEEGQTLLHVLAINSGQNDGVVRDMATMLIKRGVELDVTDSKVGSKYPTKANGM